MKKRVLSILLTICMVFTMLPEMAFAEEQAGNTEQQAQVQQDDNTGDTQNLADAPQGETAGDTQNPADAPQGENVGDSENQADATPLNNENPEVGNTLMLMSAPQGTSSEKELDIANGNISINASGYTVGDGEETPFTGNYVITGTSTGNGIGIVNLAENSTITLKDLNIDATSQIPLFIEDGMAKIQLNVEGNVSLKADAPAMGVGAPLAMRGNGNLTLSSNAPTVSCENSTSFDVEIDGDIDIKGNYAPCIYGTGCQSQLKSLNGKITITGKSNAFLTKKVTLEAKEDITVEGNSAVINSWEDVSIVSHEGSVTVKTSEDHAIFVQKTLGASFPVTIEAQKDITVESAIIGIEAPGDISLVSHAGNIDVLGMVPLICGGNVTVGAYGDITVNGTNVGIGVEGDRIALESTNGSINVKIPNSAPTISTSGKVTVTAPNGDVTLENTAVADNAPVVNGILSIAEGTVCMLNGGTKYVQFAEDGSKDRVVVPVTENLDFTKAESVAGSGYEWNKDTKTLTLNGLYLAPPNGTAIAVPDGTTMILHGKNKIAFQTLINTNRGILPYGALNVQGDGSLTMDNVQNGIEGYFDKDVEGKEIIISGGHITINAKNTGLSNKGNITVTGGNLEITANIGVVSNGDVAISEGTVTIHTKGKLGTGINVMKNSGQSTIPSVTINGGTVNITMGEAAVAGIICMNGKFVVSDGAVTVQRDSGVTEDIPAIAVQILSMTGTEPVPQNLVVDTDKVKVVEGGTITVLPWENMGKVYCSILSFSESGTLDIDLSTGTVNGVSSKVVIVPKTACKVMFDSIGGSVVAGQTVLEGGKATAPTNPTKAKSAFLGWFKDENCTVAWDFDKDTVTVDVTLYAKWKHKSSDDSGNENSGSASTSGGGSSPKQADKVETPEIKPETNGEATTAKPSTTVEGTTATAAISATEASKIIDDAVKSGSTEILIQPEVKGDVEREVVSLPKTSIADMASKSNTKLTVITPVAMVTILKEGVSALAQETGTNVSVSVEKKADNVIVEVKSDDRVLEHIEGGISVYVPTEKMTAGTVVMLEKADGTTQVLHNAVKEDGGYRVTLEGSATIKVVDNSKTFQDVQPTDWFYEAVTFATAHQLFTGTSETTFDPEAKMTRGMIVTTFHHLANNPVEGQTKFQDVPADAYYANAVAWASANNIVSGYGENFAADDEVTREQLATFMYNYAKAMELDVSVKGEMDNFSDHGEVSSWASEAMAYVVGNGIMSGKDEKTLDPKGSATRGETASLLKRFIEVTSK